MSRVWLACAAFFGFSLLGSSAGFAQVATESWPLQPESSSATSRLGAWSSTAPAGALDAAARIRQEHSAWPMGGVPQDEHCTAFLDVFRIGDYREPESRGSFASHWTTSGVIALQVSTGTAALQSPPLPRESALPAPAFAPRKSASPLVPWGVDRVATWVGGARDLLKELKLDDRSDVSKVMGALATQWVEPAQKELVAGNARGAMARAEKASRVYGAMFVLHLGWKPADLSAGGRVKTWAVQSPDGKYALSPEALISRAIEQPDSSNFALTFNLVRNGSVPPAGSGITWLGPNPS